MKKKKRGFCRLFAAVCMAVFVQGCSGGEALSSMPDCRVVEGVRVYYECGGIRLERVYLAPEKIRSILNYLRVIDPYGPPEEDPEKADGSSFRIELHYSDGCSNTYLQKGDRFMKTDGGDWKRIDPKRARELSRILGTMEADM